VNGATLPGPDTGSLSALLPGALPAGGAAGPRGVGSRPGDSTQVSDFSSFLLIASGTGAELSALPAAERMNAPFTAEGAKPAGTPESWGPSPLLRMLVPGGRISPPGGIALPPGLPPSATGTARTDAGSTATLMATATAQTAMSASAMQAVSPDAFAPALAAVAPTGPMSSQWMRALLATERGTTGSDPLLVESADAVTAGEGLFPPTVSARGATPATTIALPTSPAQQPAFEQALGDRLAWLVQEGKHDARIKLHPAELGSIDIRLSLDGDATRISLASAHAAVRDALEQAVPRLREMLGHAGLDLSHVNVGTGDARSHDNFGRDTTASADAHSSFEHADEREAAALTLAIRLPRGLVDTFA